MYELFSNPPNKWQKKYAAAGAAYFIFASIPITGYDQENRPHDSYFRGLKVHNRISSLFESVALRAAV
jgi:hypothetical protein